VVKHTSIERMNKQQQKKIDKVIGLFTHIEVLFGFAECYLKALKLNRTAGEVRKVMKDVEKATIKLRAVKNK